VLADFLRVNSDMFTWSPSDMPGIHQYGNDYAISVRRSAEQSRRRFTSYWQPDSSRRCSIPSG
jgi:hypothetical protein